MKFGLTNKHSLIKRLFIFTLKILAYLFVLSISNIFFTSLTKFISSENNGTLKMYPEVPPVCSKTLCSPFLQFHSICMFNIK